MTIDIIETCLNILNNFNDKEYEIEPIIRNQITLEDLKYNKKVNHDFKNLIYIGFYMKKWFFKTDRYNIHIGCYKNNKNLINTPPLVNIKFLYICSELILTKKINHILLPILFYDVKYDCIKKYNEFNKIPKKKDYYILISEQYDGILENYINNNKISIKEWKIIFFQILHTLLLLNIYFNDFSHNFLSIKSLCYKKCNKYIYYILNNKTIKIKSNIDIKFFNFDYSNSEDIINSNYIKNNNIYYDLYTFFNSIKKYFINTNIFVNFFKIILSKDQYLNINDLLNNEIFDEIKLL